MGNGTAWAADPLYGTSKEKPTFGGVTIGEYPSEAGYMFLYGNFMINGAYGFYDTEKHSFSFGQIWAVTHDNSPSQYAYVLGETYQVGDYSFAVGYHAQAGKYSLVLGNEAGIAGNDYAIGLGPKTAAGSYGVAIGNGTRTGTGGITIGSAYSDGTNNVNAAIANDPFSIAIGTGSEVQQNGTGNIAIGYMAQNTAGADAIVLGAFSKSDWHLNAGQQGYAPWEGSNTGNVNNSTFKNSLSSAAWKSTKGGLAIGDITGDKSTWITRQISGVAAGTQDTDAVNVAQLKAVEEEGISLTGNDNQKIT
ncbi:hypothetical protein [uncultured Megasphaera sp.]|uniref:hypothetical protein n=1 Tax=uncultured Megasphaera sp. TaxID=165188 RepID=UPI00266CD86E|nr:hypothetical protein [uncultured Megasphaera sp.]